MEEQSYRARILVAEDENIVAKDIEYMLRSLGYDVVAVVSSAEQALKYAIEAKPDLVLMDIMLRAQMDGIGAAEKIREHSDVPIIFITAYSDEQTLRRAMKTEPSGYILKPFDERELMTSIEVTLHRHQLSKTLKENEERFRCITESSIDGIVSVDHHGNILTWNLGSEKIFGYDKSEAIGEAFSLLIPERLHAVWWQKHSINTAKGRRPSGQSLILVGLRKNGEEFPMEMSLSSWHTKDGISYGGIIRDVTKRLEMERALRLSANIMDSTVEGIVVTNSEGLIQTANLAFCKATGYLESEVTGTTIRYAKSGRQDHIFYEAMWECLRDIGQWRGEILTQSRGGAACTEILNISAIRDDDNTITNYVCIFYDITKRKEMEERLRHLSLHDTTTGLANRLLFEDRMDQAFAKSVRDKEHFAVFFVDLDKFKAINDELGHQVGDFLLRGVAERLVACVRALDTVARLGGDEFTIILTDIEGRSEAESVVHKILEALGKPFDDGQHQMSVSASIGISLYPKNGSTQQDLIRAADAAMYDAKKKGAGYKFSEEEGAENV